MKLGLIGLGGVIIFSPLLYSESVNLVFEYPKYTFFQVSLSFLVIGILSFHIRKSGYSKIFFNSLLSQKEIFFIGFLFFLYNLILLFVTQNSITFFWGRYFYHFGFYTVLALVLLSIVTWYIFFFNKKEAIRLFALCIPIPIYVNAIVVFYELITVKFSLTYRAVGTFGQSNYLAAFVLQSVPILSYFVLFSRNKYLKTYHALALFLGICVLFFSGSRAGFFTFWILIFCILLIFSARFNLFTIKQKLGVSIFSIILVFLFLFVHVINRNNTVHILIWKAALELVKNNFFLGYGYGVYGSYFPEVMLKIGYTGEIFADISHNEFLDILLSVGIFGFLLVVFFHVQILKNFFTNKIKFIYKAFYFSILLSILSFWIRGFFNTNSIYQYIFYSICIGILLGGIQKGNNNKIKIFRQGKFTSSNSNKNNLVSLLLTFSLILFFIFKTILDIGFYISDIGYKTFLHSGREDLLKASIQLNPLEIEYRIALLRKWNYRKNKFNLDEVFPSYVRSQKIYDAKYYKELDVYYQNNKIENPQR